MKLGTIALRPGAAFSICVATKVEAPSRPVIFLSVMAKVRMSSAGTMATKPLGMQAMASLKVMTRRQMR